MDAPRSPAAPANAASVSDAAAAHSAATGAGSAARGWRLHSAASLSMDADQLAAAVQYPMVRYATDMGWEYLSPEEAVRLRRGEGTPILWEVVVDQLQKLNGPLPGLFVPHLLVDSEDLRHL